jgi:hypothetical protein
MTTQQLHLFNGLYFLILLVVAILTRATARRVAGALLGAAAMGLVALVIVALGERIGWWHFAIPWEPYFLTLLWIGVVPCGYIFLITWRIARRFGGRGLAVFAVVAAVIGPIRDYRLIAQFPEWGGYAPGVSPVFAIAATYVLMGVVGHGMMRMVAGPARGSPRARRPWESAQASDTTDSARYVGFWDLKAPQSAPGP